MSYAGVLTDTNVVDSILPTTAQRIGESVLPTQEEVIERARRIAPYRISQAPLMTDDLTADYPSPVRLRRIGPYHISQAPWMTVDLTADYPGPQRIFNAIQELYQSHSNPSDRRIPDRLTALYLDAHAENQNIEADSVSQFADFFRKHRDLGSPKITLTPDGTLRARWIHGSGDFTAIEFTGRPLAKLVAEIPRPGGLTARYFSTEPVDNVLTAARAVGASFA